MSEFTVPIGAVQATQLEPEAPKRRSRWLTVGLPIVAGLLVLGMGTGIGSSGSKAEIEELRASAAELQQRLDRAEAATERAETRVRAATVSLEGAQARETELQTKLAQQVEAARVLTEEKTSLTDQNSQLLSRVTELEAASASAAAAPLPLAAAPAPQPAAYYANCAAVRAAGAAPLYSGSPGYSRSLDRDGDGVACE
ncbi:excalibur calcium-binding domain-containing protein [Leucobacter sp. VD1]|uniref:excalibur calcium-binding domain-containing protein n=1 Tax=Leucobacter sp. VD1 TaxID=3080381 RepID=UPI003015E828